MSSESDDREMHVDDYEYSCEVEAILSRPRPVYPWDNHSERSATAPGEVGVKQIHLPSQEEMDAYCETTPMPPNMVWDTYMSLYGIEFQQAQSARQRQRAAWRLEMQNRMEEIPEDEELVVRQGGSVGGRANQGGYRGRGRKRGKCVIDESAI